MRWRSRFSRSRHAHERRSKSTQDSWNGEYEKERSGGGTRLARSSGGRVVADIRRVGVLGAGLMGSGIAEVCAKAGYEVVVREVDETALAAGRRRIENSLSKAIERGKLDAEARRRDPLAAALLLFTRRNLFFGSRPRGDRREPRRQARGVQGARRAVRAARDLLLEHVVAHDRRDGGRHRAAGPLRRAALLQPRPRHEARGGRAGDRDVRRDGRRA